MTNTYDGAYTPQFTVPSRDVHTAQVPQEFASFADVIDQTFGRNAPDSTGRNTTGEVGE